ncbi:MAG: hypothetical protein RXQ96_00735 [Thermocladium sp.]|jgi:hypothetical protein|nr:MAG: hypothetical protein AT710_08100 [Thermocladium sp. ECH_B]
MRNYAKRWSIICFYCLREITYRDAHIVQYYFKPLGSKFKVYACGECVQKLKLKNEEEEIQ